MDYEQLFKGLNKEQINDLSNVWGNRIISFNKVFTKKFKCMNVKKRKQYQTLLIELMERQIKTNQTLLDFSNYETALQDPSTYNPGDYYSTLTDEQHQVIKEHCRKLLEKYPDALVGECYPEMVKEIKAVKEYQSLLNEYNLGVLDIIEFNLKIKPLLEQININDLI